MDDSILICEVFASSTDCGLTVKGWDVTNFIVSYSFFMALIPVFLSAVFIGIHFTRK